MSESPDQQESPTYSKGNRILSFLGYALVLFGTGLLLLDRRSKWRTGKTYVVLESAQIPLLIIGTTIVLLGLAGFIIFKWVPRRQKEAWPFMDEEASRSAIVMNEVVLSTGTLLMPAGLISATLIYNLNLDAISPGLAVCWTAVALGALMFLWGLGRKGLLYRILATPTETIHVGQGEPEEMLADVPRTPTVDPRLAIVLPALDELLTKIHDDELEKFKGTEAARIYVELIDSLGE